MESQGTVKVLYLEPMRAGILWDCVVLSGGRRCNEKNLSGGLRGCMSVLVGIPGSTMGPALAA